MYQVRMLTYTLMCLLISGSALSAELQLVSSERFSAPLFFEDVDFVENIECNIIISGPIEAGDYEALIDFLSAKFKAPVDSLGDKYFSLPGLRFCLNSKGGSLHEALDIAELFYANEFTTVLLEGSVCYSACSVIFFSGSYFADVFTLPNRYMHTTASLGLHAPYISAGGVFYNSSDIRIAHDMGIAAFARLLNLADRGHIPVEVLQLIAGTPSNEISYIDTVNLARVAKVNVFGISSKSALVLSDEDLSLAVYVACQSLEVRNITYDIQNFFSLNWIRLPDVRLSTAVNQGQSGVQMVNFSVVNVGLEGSSYCAGDVRLYNSEITDIRMTVAESSDGNQFGAASSDYLPVSVLTWFPPEVRLKDLSQDNLNSGSSLLKNYRNYYNLK